MSDKSARRVSSLPPQDLSGLSRQSSSLFSPSSSSGRALTIPSASTTRAASNPGPVSPAPTARARRQAGGFLLDNNSSRQSSLDRADRGLYRQSRPGSTTRVEQQDDGDGDPAAMVNLVLKESQKWRRETPVPAKQKLPARALAPPSSRHQGSSDSSSRRSPISPTHTSLQARSPSTSKGPGRKHVPPSPPPPSVTGNFPSPPLQPLQIGGDFQHHMWWNGFQLLQEDQEEYKVSDATLQRALKARQSLELSALFKELLDSDLAAQQKPKELSGAFCQYNPLQLIRNRKLRTREKVQLDISQWQDPAAVRGWVEGGECPAGSPHPPSAKRPKMDWVVEPEELFADYYWMLCKYQRGELGKVAAKTQPRGTQGVGDPPRAPLNTPPNSLGYSASHDVLETGATRGVPRTRQTARARKSRQLAREDEDGSETPATSSEDGGNSDSDDADDTSASEDRHKNPKHHRRRRKLKRMIPSRLHGTKKLKHHELELEEKQRKQEAEEMDWVVSENEDVPSAPVPRERVEYRKSFEADEDYESATAGKSPIKSVEKTATGLSYTTAHGGSKSSLERVDTVAPGFGVAPVGADKSEYVVPSIAISLTPPRMRPQEPDDKEEDKRDTKASPHKKLLGMRKDGMAKEREATVEDSGRESLDVDRSNKKPSEKERGSRRGKVKSRVDKLRSEVSKVEELIPWRRDNGPVPSPTASSFTASDDEDRAIRAVGREDTHSASEPEDLESTKHIDNSSKQVLNFPESALDHYSQGSSQVFSDAPEEPLKLSRSFELTRSSSPAAISKRELQRTRACLISSGIVSRQIGRKTPIIFNPLFREINKSTRTLDSLLETYHVKHAAFIDPTVPEYRSKISSVDKHVTHHLTPMVRHVADEADRLSAVVTTELTLSVKKLQEDIFRLARKKRGRGKMRRVVRVLSVTIEWTVKTIMWAIWIVVLVLKVARKVAALVIRVVRWVLWL